MLHAPGDYHFADRRGGPSPELAEANSRPERLLDAMHFLGLRISGFERGKSES